MQYYSDQTREDDPHALPNIEVFYMDTRSARLAGLPWGKGWYWWACFPGCLPDSDPHGPFETDSKALEDARS